ncbi:MAG: PaeR7I family type II restriction endonuclease [Planctomycetaceae bacterium]
MLDERALKRGVTAAVRHFWRTRTGQSEKQRQAGQSDQGSRGAVTGGKQMDGFVKLATSIIESAGMSSKCIHSTTSVELPGFFRPEKKWDLVVVDNNTLVAAIEFKSQVGPSFGNNFNNRAEEAIGTAQDIWTAYREGAFPLSSRPWLGYLMMLEDCERSTSPVSVRRPNFPTFPEFEGASYAERYRLLMTKLVRERLYDSACFLMSSVIKGARGISAEPASELAVAQFAASLSARITTHLASLAG